ncbi:enoyl-CoA-hydratase DpgB [Spirillospora sp. CA-253888]
MVSAGRTLDVDGTAMPSAHALAELAARCDRAEDDGASGPLILRVSGAPAPGWTAGIEVGAVSRWEWALRRLERLPAVTVAVASGDCGGAALDAFLAADLRIAVAGTRLLVSTDGEATWPGMALFRLARQGGAAVRGAVLFGRPIDTAWALALGIVDEVAESPETAVRLGADLAGDASGREVAIRRRLMSDALTSTFEDAIGPHLAACDRSLRRVRERAAAVPAPAGGAS